MKYEITRSNEVGKAEHGWLHAKHYFSFGNYYNPEKLGFGKLRVINDDIVEPSRGFGTHPHKNMEIITIPLSGSVHHKDSKGNEGVIGKGEVQVMSAGTGVFHSEFNGSHDESLNLFQIWIEPNELQVEPRYDQRKFDFHHKKGEWTQLVSPMNSELTGLKIYQDAYISASYLENGSDISYQLHDSSNGVYVLVAEGRVDVNGQVLDRRDSIAVENVQDLKIKAIENAEVIVIEVPMQ